jgi:hypothetical protein
MSIAEIMTGKGTYHPGLIPLCHAYLDFIQCDHQTREKVRFGGAWRVSGFDPITAGHATWCDRSTTAWIVNPIRTEPNPVS